MSDLQLQEYLFDLQGYLVIENVLSPEEVTALNQHIDDQQLPTPEKAQRFGSAPDGSGFLQMGQTVLRSTRPPQDYVYTSIPFRRLLPARPNLRDVYAGRNVKGTVTCRLRRDLSDSKSEGG